MKTIWLDTDIGSGIDNALLLTAIVDGVTPPVVFLVSTQHIVSQYS